LKVTKQWLLNSARDEAEKYFCPDSLLCIIPRETAWYGITLLESDLPADRKMANRIFEHLTVTDGTHSPCTLFVIYQRYRGLLSEQAQRRILQNLKQNLTSSATVRYSDGNVNHPLAAYVNLICSGELVNDSTSVILGKKMLQIFQQTIATRRHVDFQQAEMAEYNSPTYTALDLWFLAIAAEFAGDAHCRALARFLEERLWINVAMHWHAPTQQFAGPFSRAYAEDSIGGFSALHSTFGYATQRDIYLNPELAVRFNHPSALIENAFIATLNFHLPEQALKIAFEKPRRYYFRMTTYCEQYHENCAVENGETRRQSFDTEVYPGGWGELSTFLTEEYCLGTACRPYVNGAQNDTFSLRYRRRETITDFDGFRGAFTRMVFNGSRFGKDNFCHVTRFSVTRHYLYEEGRPFCFQHKDQSILCYIPKRGGRKGVNELRLDLIFSSADMFDLLKVDATEVTRLPFETRHCNLILLADFNTYLAIFPLEPTLLAGFPGRMEISNSTGFLTFSFYNYLGDTHDFDKELLSQVVNGFGFVLATRQEFPKIEDFHNQLRTFRLSRTIEPPFVHHIQFQTAGAAMTFRFDPLSERILERSLNGEEQQLCHFEIEKTDAGDRIFYPSSLYQKTIIENESEEMR